MHTADARSTAANAAPLFIGAQAHAGDPRGVAAAGAGHGWGWKRSRTFLNPICSARSRKQRRQRSRPYLRIRPECVLQMRHLREPLPLVCCDLRAFCAAPRSSLVPRVMVCTGKKSGGERGVDGGIAGGAHSSRSAAQR